MILPTPGLGIILDFTEKDRTEIVKDPGEYLALAQLYLDTCLELEMGVPN